jgi:hypothetical protein
VIGLVPLALLEEVAGAGEGERQLAVAVGSVAAAVVEVKVGVDDDVHILGPDALAGHVLHQRPRLSDAGAARDAGRLIAHARLDQDQLAL